MMKFLIPTAKEMTLTQASSPLPIPDKTQQIVNQLLQDTSLEHLAAFYKISPEKAKIEQEHLLALGNGTAKAYPAISLFNGLMYRSIDRQFSPRELAYLQQNVFITSALYGIIPADAPIAPHRLDFMTKLDIDGQTLKAFWRSDFDQFLTTKTTYISLLSSEFEAVFSKTYRDRLIHIQFAEEKKGQLKTHATISKKARGAFLSQAIKKQVSKVADLKTLSFDQFHYRPDLSTPQQLVFTKTV